MRSVELPACLPGALRARSPLLVLAKGDTLFRHGQEVAPVHFVEAGEVQALLYLADGSQAVLMRGSAGEFLDQSAVRVPG